MKRTPAAVSSLVALVVGVSAALALGQGLKPKKVELPKPEANLFWTHPFGHSTTAPCQHVIHPGGDSQPNAPCNCPKLPQHLGGDPTTIPCVHMHLRHPGGHDTGKKDLLGNKIMSPCTEWDQDHPNGDAGPNKPCTHFNVAPHPNGHPFPNKPCEHKQHPEGHGGPNSPCPHPMPMDLTPNDLGLNFYTTDPSIQSFVKEIARQFEKEKIKIGLPRKLSVFFRDPINGDPNDNTDPFWSHYEDVTHAIQLTKGNPMDSLRDTARHEMGHALLGHRVVHIKSPNGPHAMDDAKDEGLAMSEGWAHFVGLFLTPKGQLFKGRDWDNGHLDTSIPFSTKNEFRVGCVLWDLIDPSPDKTSRGMSAFGAPNLTFADLFRVYSPTLATLRKGPVIPSIDDFLARLKKNHPTKTAQIDAVRNFNLNPK